ncbi:MAG: hypothetical protein MdMp014T_1508 [Treponematales bacterium]|jgi:hypothetical protein
MKLLRLALLSLTGLAVSSCCDDTYNDITFINRASSPVTIVRILANSFDAVIEPGHEQTLRHTGAATGSTMLMFDYEMDGVQLSYPPKNTPDDELIYMRDEESKTVTIYDDYCDVR